VKSISAVADIILPLGSLVKVKITLALPVTCESGAVVIAGVSFAGERVASSSTVLLVVCGAPTLAMDDIVIAIAIAEDTASVLAKYLFIIL
jgi:hypothetical protein